MEIKLKRSSKPNKKYMVEVDGRTIHFGAKGYDDYTTSKSEDKKRAYIARHGANNEDWTKSGIKTAGFWAKNILWSKPTIKESIKDVEKRFGVKIKNLI